MCTIVVWNFLSTNFGDNNFVRENGTDTLVDMSETNAMLTAQNLMQHPSIDSFVLESPNGVLSWKRHPKPLDCDCCDECGKCDGCHCDEDGNLT